MVLNTVTKRVIEEVKGTHPSCVFTYNGKPVGRMYTTSWKKARERAGLPQVRVHDLKHTFGRRLRLQGYPLKTGRISDEELLAAIDRMTLDHGETEIVAPQVQKMKGGSEKKGNKKVTSTPKKHIRPRVAEA